MDTIEKAVAKLSGKRADAMPHEVEELSPLRHEKDLVGGELQLSQPDNTLQLTERLKANGFLYPGGDNIQQIEEYRRIKRPLLMSVDGDKEGKAANLIMITSSLPGEGKTFTSINLAVSIAMELDRTVLLVDADVHKPATSTILGVADHYGLTDVLASDEVGLADVLIKTDIPKMTLLAVGKSRDNSNELLASSYMSKLMNELAHRYKDRIIIIDTPPILATNEAAILAHLAGQVLVVVEAEKTQYSVLDEALSTIDIDSVHAGLVLNKGRISSGRSSYYGGYGYSAQS